MENSGAILEFFDQHQAVPPPVDALAFAKGFEKVGDPPVTGGDQVGERLGSGIGIRAGEPPNRILDLREDRTRSILLRPLLRTAAHEPREGQQGKQAEK